MKYLNYNKIMKMGEVKKEESPKNRFVVHKINEQKKAPKLSLVLLDWEVREQFNSLLWLGRQNIPRDHYEIIWVELYKRVVPEVLEHADVVITCNQKGMYHKHEGYNVGLLKSRGELVTICDSDAVFPTNFVSSIFEFFFGEQLTKARSAVYMHYEPRSTSLYPDGLEDADELSNEHWVWWGLHPNVGACMTVRYQDAIRFGGFDEHKSYRGYLCGPYDLGWRLVNAGLPEVWCPPQKCSIYHFSHPDPTGTQGFIPQFKHLREMTHPHVDLHAWAAVEGFSSGRILPLWENLEVFHLRMKDRKIGTEFETKYAVMTGPKGFSYKQHKMINMGLLFRIFKEGLYDKFKHVVRVLLSLLNPFTQFSIMRNSLFPKTKPEQDLWFGKRLYCAVNKKFDKPNNRDHVIDIVYKIPGYNFVAYGEQILAISSALGHVDVTKKETLRIWQALENPLIFVGKSVIEVRNKIPKSETDKNGNVDNSVGFPKLIVENFSGTGYNVIEFGDKFYARRQKNGVFCFDDKNLVFDNLTNLKKDLVRT